MLESNILEFFKARMFFHIVEKHRTLQLNGY